MKEKNMLCQKYIHYKVQCVYLIHHFSSSIQWKDTLRVFFLEEILAIILIHNYLVNFTVDLRKLFCSSSSSDDSDSDDIPCADTGSLSLSGDVPSIDNVTTEEDVNQPTMWLGTEDGCIHVYNCNDNIRIKKNKVKIQHNSSVHCIM